MLPCLSLLTSDRWIDAKTCYAKCNVSREFFCPRRRHLEASSPSPPPYFFLPLVVYDILCSLATSFLQNYRHFHCYQVDTAVSGRNRGKVICKYDVSTVYTAPSITRNAKERERERRRSANIDNKKCKAEGFSAIEI